MSPTVCYRPKRLGRHRFGDRSPPFGAISILTLQPGLETSEHERNERKRGSRSEARPVRTA
ncbi:hypothetical protein BRC68_13735 [Halobacteriales archaeon QH_6_64_20]|nr:MAG: hypothetical protein BRC68_13735 [Halobacteriales archaeon QH_6_64_20]